MAAVVTLGWCLQRESGAGVGFLAVFFWGLPMVGLDFASWPRLFFFVLFLFF